MNLQHLKYFITAVEEGSISKAAAKLQTSQPSVSRQIKAFEESLGLKLFNRGAKSVELTHEGKITYKEGCSLLRNVDKTFRRIKQQAGKGSIRIGYAPTLAKELLELSIADFSKTYPDIRIHLHDMSSAEMRSALLDETLDLIIDERNNSTDIHWHTLYALPRVYAVPSTSELFNNANVSPSEINDQQLVLMNRHDYPSYWHDVTGYFKEHSINAKIMGEFDGIDSIAVALKAELGIGIISEKSNISEKVRKIHANPELPPIYAATGLNASVPPPSSVKAFCKSLHENLDSSPPPYAQIPENDPSSS